jgi:cell division protein FtsN
MRSQRGGFAMGLVAGLLIGLALALGVALYITKAPIPFMNKVPQRTAEMDNAEAARNRNWDPNAALGGRTAGRAASAAAASASAAPAVSTPAPPASAQSPGTAASRAPVAAVPASAGRPAVRDPAAILSGESTSAPARSTAAGAEPFVYFVQAGAFTRNEEAEQQRARLAMMGQGAKITEREQAGRTVYRVRMGPYPTRGEADALQVKLQEQGIEAQLVRVEKP